VLADQVPIQNCTTTETSITDSQGKIWKVCFNSDYHGNTIQVVGNIQSQTDCVNLCTSQTGCAKGVFDKVGYYCHLKSADQQTIFYSINKFDTVRLDTSASAPIADRQPIIQCLRPEYNISDSTGAGWTVCPNSDYWGNTIQVVWNINSMAICQKTCQDQNGCAKAVFDKQALACHLKSDYGQDWRSSTNTFDTVRRVSQGGPGGGPSGGNGQIPAGWTCNGQQSVLTTTDGSTWARCTNTDWQGRSIWAIDNFQTAQACAEACSLTPICTNAVWDNTYKYCHFKDTAGGLTQANNNQFDQLRLIQKAPPKSTAANVGGKWSDRIVFPIVPAAAYLVPEQPTSNRVMAFSAAADYSFAGSFGQTQFATWNYNTGAMSHRTVQNTNHDMFCPGISTLANGQVVVTGGDDANVTSIYDPVKDSFFRAPNMNMGRGYQSSCTLSNGKVFTIGGSFTGGDKTKNGEVYDPTANTWTFLNGCNADALNTRDNVHRRDNHAWLYGWTDGSIFQAGPSGQMNWYGTYNGGTTTSAGTRNFTADAMCGTNVMFDTGKILSAGGGPFYDNNSGVTTAQVITIPSKVGGTATAQQATDMKYPRMFANSVVLPDGSVVVTGGQKFGRGFNDIESILYPELYNPRTNTWTVMNIAAVPRNYHSVSLLLGDGRVMAAGGGLCYTWAGQADTPANWQCDSSAQHPDAEIFSPPYLFNADGSAATRPQITGLKTTNDANGNWVRAGGTLTITMAVSEDLDFSVIRLGSATHSVNTDQRRLSLTSSRNGNTFTVKLPSDSGVLLPGYWFLFASKTGNLRTPSIARVIQVRL
jgi:galactose oxidase